MPLLRQCFVLLALALVVGGGWYAWARWFEPADQRMAQRHAMETGPAPVVVEPVRAMSDAAVVEAVGTGVAQRAVELTPEAAGRVVEVGFAAGERVEADAPLLRLDDADERLALERARVVLDDVRRQVARYERLSASGAVSTVQLDTARSELAAAEIDVRQAELALARRTLRAPFAGTTGIPSVDVGDRVDEDTSVGTLDDLSALMVDFAVPEAFLLGIRQGGPVDLAAWARPGELFEAEVAAIGSRVDPVARTVVVRALVDNARRTLKPGMSFTVRLPLSGERYPSVPSIAVRWQRGGAFVWKVADDQAVRVPVEVLKRSDDWVLVDAALEPGEPVVVEGMQRLTPGRAVRSVSGSAVARLEGAADGG